MPPVVSNKDSVTAKSLAYMAMLEDWRLIDDLVGGTRTMRAAAQHWLPMEPREKPETYTLRLSRSFLYNGFDETTTRLASKPFTKPVQIKGALPAGFDDFVLDVDGEGHDLTQFAADLFKNAVRKGLAGILIDYPTVASVVQSGTPPTLEDERVQQLMPYFVFVEASQIYGFKYERIGRKKELTELRIAEETAEPDGKYGVTVVKRVRVWTKTDWSVYRIEADGAETLESSAPHTFGSIPFVELNLEPVGPLHAKPPMKDLAWLNVMHWQSSSDQRWILRVARGAILFAKGFEEDELEGMIIGPTHIVKASNIDADMKHVEHTGAAIGAGQIDIDKIEARMEVLGLQPVVKTSVNKTATGQVIDEVKSMTVMQAWVRLTEIALELAFAYAAKWRGVDLLEDFGVDIYSDFNFGDVKEIDALMKMRLGGEITRSTFLKEIARRGLLSDDVDLEQEIKDLDSEEANALAQARAAGFGDPSRAPFGAGEDPAGSEDDADAE